MYKVRSTDSAVMWISCYLLYNYGHSLLMNRCVPVMVAIAMYRCVTNALMASVHPIFDYNQTALWSFHYYRKHRSHHPTEGGGRSRLLHPPASMWGPPAPVGSASAFRAWHRGETAERQGGRYNTRSSFKTSRCNNYNIRLKTNETFETCIWNTYKNTWNHYKYMQHLDKTLGSYVLVV